MTDLLDAARGAGLVWGWLHALRLARRNSKKKGQPDTERQNQWYRHLLLFEVQGKILPVQPSICLSNGNPADFPSMFNFVCSMWLHLSKMITKHILTAVMHMNTATQQIASLYSLSHGIWALAHLSVHWDQSIFFSPLYLLFCFHFLNNNNKN